MQILLTNKFVTFEYHPEKSLIYFYWTTTSQKVQWIDYQSIMENFKSFLLLHKPQFILADLKDFLFVVNETQQQWLDTEVNGTAVHVGVSKLAVVIPVDTYTHISSELVMMEDMASLLNYEFFPTLDMANKWLFTK